MIRIDTKQAALEWVAAWRRGSDAALTDERRRGRFLMWWIEIVPQIYPGTSVTN